MSRSSITIRLASVACFLVLWELVARLLATKLLPPASAVILLLGKDIASGELPRQLGITLLRVAASFALAMVLGTLLGFALGRSRRLDQFFDSWLTGLLNLPALVTIVLLYVWFGLNEYSAVAAVALNKAAHHGGHRPRGCTCPRRAAPGNGGTVPCAGRAPTA